MEANQRIIREIGDTLSNSMTRVEQFIDWEVALEGGSDDYFKACEAILEPRFSDDEVSNEFSFCINNNYDLWKQYVINSAEYTLNKESWVKLIDVLAEYGY